MPRPLFSLQGDTLDRMIWRNLGTTDGTVEEALTNNPGVAALGAILPLNTRITPPEVPDDQTVAVQALVSIWE